MQNQTQNHITLVILTCKNNTSFQGQIKLFLKHRPVRSVKELQVGAELGEVAEPNKMSLEVRASGEVVGKVQTGRISKIVVSRRKVGGGG